MSTFKVKLTPLTPIGVSHAERQLPVESKRDIIPPADTWETPDLSALLDWRFDALPSQLPPTLEEVNMMFPSDFPVFGSSAVQPAWGEQGFSDFESGEYHAVVEAFCTDEHPFPFTPPQESAAELWELTQSTSLFSISEFLAEAQENRYMESGFEELSAFGIDFDEPPQSSSEGSSEDGHCS